MSRVESEPLPSTGGEARWSPRPWTARGLKVVVIAVPLVASVIVSVTVAGLLPVPTSTGGQILWWAAILATSSLVLIAGEAAARRALPLVSLLRLSLLFPGHAPSRVGIARRSSRSELARLADQVRVHGLGPDAEAAAVTLVRLVAALDAHDRRTRGHSERVRVYTDLLAHRLHLDAEATNKLRWAALLHDIGKLAVPAEVLNKPGRLTAEEWELIHRHPAEGDRMLGALKEWLGPWALVVLEHHERWDGTGYPAGIPADRISLGARLVAVADSYDVMTSVRSYQPRPRTPEAARDELVRCSGSQFDPGMVRCFLNISTRRLWWLLGPVTWLVQVPVVGRAAVAAVRRPSPALGELGHVMACGVAVLAMMPGIGVDGTGQLPAAGAEAAAPARTAQAWRFRRLDPVPIRRTTPAIRPNGHAGEATVPAATPSIPVRPGAGAPAPAAPAPAAAPRPAPAPVGPAPAPTPPSKPTPAPVPPPAKPGGDPPPPAKGSGGSEDPEGGDHGGGDDGHHGHGYGHTKGRGKGHDHHDDDGDGVDDKAGTLLSGLTGRHHGG